MSVSEKDVKHIADLARLQFTNEESAELADAMNQILAYVDKLQEVDTTNVEPLEHITTSKGTLRADHAEEPLSHEEALKNAPEADSDYFRVPRVIE